jgi:hypothetical protein
MQWFRVGQKSKYLSVVPSHRVFHHIGGEVSCFASQQAKHRIRLVNARANLLEKVASRNRTGPSSRRLATIVTIDLSLFQT